MDHVEETYASKDGIDLKIDVFAPTNTKLDAAVLLLHGGAWRHGERSMVHNYARHLAGRGFTALAVQYRLLGQAAWPAALEDVLSAIDWVRSNAGRLEVSAERIALEGFSAGAHLALLAAGQPGAVAAVVAFFPPTRLAVFPSDPADSPADMLFGPDPKPQAAELASPINLANPSFPPSFFLHGSADWLVSPKASIAMHSALEALGAKTELHIFVDQHHEFSATPKMLGPVQDEVIDFLMRTVIDPAGRTADSVMHNPFAAGPPSAPQS